MNHAQDSDCHRCPGSRWFLCFQPGGAQQASPPYVAGGAQQIAGWCKVGTDDRGDDSYGYYQACGGQALASALRRSRRAR